MYDPQRSSLAYLIRLTVHPGEHIPVEKGNRTQENEGKMVLVKDGVPLVVIGGRAALRIIDAASHLVNAQHATNSAY